MSHRCLPSTCALVVGIAVVALAPISGQAPKAGARTTATTSTSLRTPWGDPDLEGVWDFRTVTPMERPKELAGKSVLTNEEAAKFEAEETRKLSRDLVDPKKGGFIYPPGGVVPYNDFWFDYGNKVTADKRTSLIVDPPDGRIPWTQAGLRAADDAAADGQEGQLGRPRADSPEEISLGVRCIVGFNSGPPIVPSAYNNNVQLVQTAGSLVILTEMVHEARVVPLDGRPHLDQKIRLRSGDPRGRWEGNTLVIDTTNFYGGTSFTGSSANMHLIERLTRVDADTLLYEFTVNDPTMWTKPWTAAVPWKKNQGRVYEYACSEGNYGLLGILVGARADEKAGKR